MPPVTRNTLSLISIFGLNVSETTQIGCALSIGKLQGDFSELLALLQVSKRLV